MASAISHAVVAAALGTALHARAKPLRFWLIGAACAVLPDLDVVTFRFGIPYEAPWGHRGASHSLVFAAVLAALATPLCLARAAPGLGWARVGCFLFLATASHGVLDAFTNGGLGVAFFWPFDETRIFFPFRPLQVSPLGIGEFLGPRGVAVLRTELVWLWAPSALLAALGIGCRSRLLRSGRGVMLASKRPRGDRA